jgi:hypothetical protein
MVQRIARFQTAKPSFRLSADGSSPERVKRLLPYQIKPYEMQAPASHFQRNKSEEVL